MKLRIHFTSIYCDVFYNSELNCVETQWHGQYCFGNDLKRILRQIIQQLVKYETGTVLADARKMRIIKPEDRKWIQDEWYPSALEAGFNRQALIIEKDSFNEHSIKQILTVYDYEKVKTCIFRDYEPAVEWIKTGKCESEMIEASKLRKV